MIKRVQITDEYVEGMYNILDADLRRGLTYHTYQKIQELTWDSIPIRIEESVKQEIRENG
jgi:hypothetical protein